jgi:hypothetical protein
VTPRETFRVSVNMAIAAEPAVVFDYVSDLSKSGEWSPECLGGSWVSGTPSEVGSVFAARNHREPEVVSWAPVVRGEWSTECEVVESSSPKVFSWAMRDSAGKAQESVWSFEIESSDGGSVLTHAFRMGELTEGMRGIFSRLTGDEEQKFLLDWAGKLDGDMRRSLARIKAVLESA